MLICQITDLHIKARGQKSYGVVDTHACLAACIDRIEALPQAPDVLVITGDLVDSGRAEEYRVLRELLSRLSLPIYVLPGNHDDRDALRQAFADHDYLPPAPAKLHYVIERYPLRLIALDTVVPMQSGGAFDAADARWLEAALAQEPERPTLLMMHHPPFATGIGHMDDIGLQGATRFAEVVSRHPQIERITCGHLHRSISTRLGHTIAATCPSPAHQVVLDLDAKATPQFVMEPPGYQLHLWQPGRGLVCHTAVIGHYPGPYLFFDEAGSIDEA